MGKSVVRVAMKIFVAMSSVALLTGLSGRKMPSANSGLISCGSDRSLSLCLNCGLNITFLEENETLAPTQLLTGSTPSPAVVPDSQLGLGLSPPTMTPTPNESFYNDTLSETFGDDASKDQTMDDSISNSTKNTSKSSKGSAETGYRGFLDQAAN